MLKRQFVAAIDRYRARVAPTCGKCQANPTASFSYRVRQRVIERGVLAGLLMLGVGWLAHMGRFERGGW